MTLALALTQILAATGCVDEPTAPTPPDVSDVTNAYRNPSGVLTSATVARVQPVLNEILAVIRKVDNFDDISENVREAQKEIDSLNGTHGPSEFPIEILLEGSAVLTAPCAGWSDDDPTPGEFNLTMGFNHDGLLPTIWGDLLKCHLGGAEDSVGLHGSLILTMTGGTGYDSDHVGALTYIFEGNVSAPQVDGMRLDFDFQIPEPGGLLVRLPLLSTASDSPESADAGDSGNLIYFQTIDDTLGFIGDNGTFTCNFEERSCVNSDVENNSAIVW